MQRFPVVTCLGAAFLGAFAFRICEILLFSPSASHAQAPAPVPVRQPARPAQPDGGPEDMTLTVEERVNIRVYERANHGVVNITTRTARPDQFFMVEIPEEGSGSGSVLDQEGHILTNYHVIENASQIQVTLFNGESYEANPVGADPVNDVAILRIDAPSRFLFPLVNSPTSRLKVGQHVYAIGNPFGFERTMTVGIVSSLNRQLPSRSGRTMKSLIQIDAALNRGNSGGPLLDSGGRLIGMNTAIASQTGENTGVGFAIPISTLNRVVPELLQHGRVVRPDIGITRVQETERGLLIAGLVKGGAADRAGLQGFRVVRQQRQRGGFVFERTFLDRSAADLIVAINDVPVRTVDELLTEVEKHAPQDEVSVSIHRKDQLLRVRVQLDSEK